MSPARAARSEFEDKKHFGDYPVHINRCLWKKVEKCGTNSLAARHSRHRCSTSQHMKCGGSTPFSATRPGLAYSRCNNCFPGRSLPAHRHFYKRLKSLTGVDMLLSTDFASESDLLDRVMDRGIVVEVWDRLSLAGIDMTGMRVTISSFRLFADETTPTFRTGYFSRTKSS
jgi:hypothetical protein